MIPKEYKNIYENESSHFFYVSTHELITQLIKSYSLLKRKLKILDAGCGTGLLAVKLGSFGEVSAVDSSKIAVEFAKKRGVNAKIASISKLPYKNNTFDIVTCVDVLYHKNVKSDTLAISELFRVLKPGGLVVVRTAANSWLRLVHDQLVHGIRRYDYNQLKSLVSHVGFSVVKISYVHSLLFPVVVLQHILRNFMSKKSSITQIHWLLNQMLTKLLLLEIFFIKKISVPFGVGLVVVGRK